MSLILNRSQNIGAFFESRTTSAQSFYPSSLSHIYIKLDLEKRYENAECTNDAKSFLRSVTRASILIHHIVQKHSGNLIEIQGSLMHVVLPANDGTSNILNFSGALHTDLTALFKDSSEKVKGWRMIADTGKTLLVNGPSIHGDQSTVSLGNAANRPAKRLYQQLAITNEENRSLKRGHLEIRNNGNWLAVNLNGIVLTENFSVQSDIITEIKNRDLSKSFENILKHQTTLNASAAPVGKPTFNNPQISWGWILRSDLDGFTQRVSNCYDDDVALTKLAEEFVSIMIKAASFAETHSEMITQLPWAGDNFNAVANYADKQSYEIAVEENLIGLSVDFEEDLHQSALNAGCGGWSQCVAGGYPHGNSSGNVYVSSILVEGQTFLVGVGMGIGKSLQAMSDISPAIQEIVILSDDYEKIHESYRSHFHPSEKKVSQKISTIFKSADIKQLENERDNRATEAKPIAVTSACNATTHISTRPYYNG